MGKVTIVLLAVSTALLLAAFTKGVALVQGGHDVMGHMSWAVGALVGVLAANFFAMLHAAQSDRLIRELRRALEAAGQQRSTPLES